MQVCSQCKKVYRKESRFCSECGIPLVEIPDNTAPETESLQQGPGYPPAPNNTAMGASAANKTSGGAIAGMFIVNVIPILGFPAAFLWAWAKFKKKKAKLTAFTAAFLILNIAATLFGYAATIALMKNSLERASEKQNSAVASALNDKDQQASSSNHQVPGQSSAQNEIPGIDGIPIQGIPGLDPNMLNQLVPGFSGIPEEAANIDPEDYQIPEGVSMPETDEQGNMHIDTDGDGKQDTVIDSEGSIISQNGQMPTVDSDGNISVDSDGDGKEDTFIDESGNITKDGNKLMETDENGNVYFDTDGDGKYDGYFDNNGNFIPDNAKTDAQGNKFIDYDGDGTCETLIDSEGAVHYDLDGDGVYESEQEWSDGGL